MRHIFIVNNVAGGGKNTVALVPKIDSYFHSNGGDYEIVTTKCKGDATAIARKYAQSGEDVRLYSCGGDGTLHEVVNGAAGFKNVEVGVFPCGSGNDYVAAFGDKDAFLDVKAQVEGGTIDVDLILTEGIYSINQCSMGFDAAVADNFSKFKGKPLISGSMAYMLSVVYTLAGKLGNKMKIYIDDRPEIEGNYLFAISAKGKYHGGGMMSAPQALPYSRTLNFVTVKSVTKLQFLKLLPSYIKGEHLKFTDIVTSTVGKKMRVVADKPLPVTLDGEIIVSSDITSEIVRGGLKFVIPSTVACKTEEKVKKPAYAKN